jgi:hypothetical protein
LAFFAFWTVGAGTGMAAPRKPIAPPKVLNVVRQTLKRGAAPAYEEIEVLIADGYRRARIPMYWICLQMTGNPHAILYLNVYHAREEADRAAATYTNMVPKHADLLRLQQRLTQQTASPPISMLATRRDEFVLGRRDVDFATMRALRVSVFHVRAGREGEFVDAAQTGRAVPWQLYEDSTTSTFFLLTPLRTTWERDHGLPRGLRQLKGVYTVDKPVVYAVRPAMSHAPPEYVTANPRYRQVRSTKSEVRP